MLPLILKNRKDLKHLIQSDTEDLEVINARGDFPILKDRLDNSDSQLAQTALEVEAIYSTLAEEGEPWEVA